MDFSMYDTLLGLPLLQGLSKTELEDVLAKVRFDFSSVQDGDTFIKAGDVCDSFVFLLGGCVMSRCNSADGRLSFGELLSGPALLEPYSMFGMHPLFRKSYTASGSISILRLDKQYLYSELYKYNICRMNLLNMLSGRIQSSENERWDIHGTTIRERIVALMKRLSEGQQGYREIRVRMEDLAEILGETRLNVSRTLNQMADDNVISLKRGGFDIPSLELL